MCIIGYAPKGVKIEERTIKAMFSCNPDGAGIMWKPLDGGSVEIRKGFMKVEELIKAWNKIPVECEKAIHCRIATSGKISKECCHPFPVRPKTGMMKKLSDKCYMALMHNGVIHQCTPVKGIKADYSDSMLFAAKYLYPLQKMIDKDCVQDLLEGFSTSRLLIMRADAKTIMLGNWIEDNGVFYSNSTYKDISYGYSEWSGSKTSYGDLDSPSWIVLDIGKDSPTKAAKEVEDTLEAHGIFYDYIDDGIDGELSFEAWDFPKNCKNVGKYKVVDRIDDEPEPHDDYYYDLGY